MLLGFDLSAVLIMCLVTAVSSFFQGALGMGFAVLFMVVMPNYVGYSGGLAVMYVVYMFIIGFTLFQLRKQANFKKCLQIGWPCLITNGLMIIAGTFIVKAVEAIDPDILTKSMGVILLLIAIYFFIFSKKVKIRPTIPKGLTMGALGGVLAGVIGVGGPPVSIYLLNATDNPYDYLASIQLTYTFGSLVGMITHFSIGTFTPQVIAASAINIPPTILGTFLGILLIKRLNEDLMKKFVYIFMGVMGILLIVN